MKKDIEVGDDLHILHTDGETTTAALLDPTDQSAEVVTLRHAEEGDPVPPGHCLLTTEPSGRSGVIRVRAVHKGPAAVTTPAYREGWDRIFGGRERGKA